jgi:predicted acylesterase/phospholipase RssA
MAVCELLRRYQANGRIQINRVAGSSAGAIAAAMLASKKSVETFRSEIKAIDAPKADINCIPTDRREPARSAKWGMCWRRGERSQAFPRVRHKYRNQ